MSSLLIRCLLDSIATLCCNQSLHQWAHSCIIDDINESFISYPKLLWISLYLSRISLQYAYLYSKQEYLLERNCKTDCSQSVATDHHTHISTLIAEHSKAKLPKTGSSVPNGIDANVRCKASKTEHLFSLTHADKTHLTFRARLDCSPCSVLNRPSIYWRLIWQNKDDFSVRFIASTC